MLDWAGRPLLIHVIEQMLAAGCGQVIIVLGAYAEEISPIVRSVFGSRQVAIVFNSDWQNGQAKSLHIAIKAAIAIAANFGSDSRFLLCVCDQPMISIDALSSLSKHGLLTGKAVIATRYPDGGGVPACFSREALAALAAQGDQGARNWIRKQPSEAVELIDIPAALLDIDTQSDYELLLHQQHLQ